MLGVIALLENLPNDQDSDSEQKQPDFQQRFPGTFVKLTGPLILNGSP